MSRLHPFPRLQSATFEPLSGDGEVDVSYKSGARFKGQVQGHKKIGSGIFTWPNGARYEGEYQDNNREGTGIQLWQDGSKYEGQFHNDLRHGQGEHIWANKEKYKGKFFQDRRHGLGVYTWPDGSTFTGTFYMDRKEGYGMFKFANGSSFEGLYKEDEREGPGVMTYSDGTQDVGLWHGEKLVKICSPIPGAFAMKNHKDFDYNPKEHVFYLTNNGISCKEAFESVLKEPNAYYAPENHVTEKVTEMFNIVLDPRSLAVNKEVFDKEFYPQDETDKDEEQSVQVWNKTPSIIVMQRHFQKHRYGVKSLTFKMENILSGNRSGFNRKGPLEQSSEELILAATEGNVNKVEDLLSSGKVSADVADCDGHTPLIGATVNWHIDVINCLLNHGADVNKLSDEGCSALSAGCIFFYPIESFHYNIAERYLEEPKDLKSKQKDEKSKVTNSQAQTQSQQPSQSSQGQTTPRSILSKKQTGNRKTSNLQILDNVSSEPGSESGSQLDLNKNVKNMQNVKQQVRIEESKPSKQDSAVKQDESMSAEEFDSNMSLKYYEIVVTDQLIERCATQLSMNEKVVAGKRSHNSADLGTARHLAVIKNERERMKATLDLLLQRGADPNASGVPMPVLFFAIKAADVEMVKSLYSTKRG